MKWYHIAFNQEKRVRGVLERKEAKATNYDSRVADREIYHCTKCDICWEKTYRNNSHMVERYKDFVTYGKKKKTCYGCKIREQKGLDK